MLSKSNSLNLKQIPYRQNINSIIKLNDHFQYNTSLNEPVHNDITEPLFNNVNSGYINHAERNYQNTSPFNSLTSYDRHISPIDNLQVNANVNDNHLNVNLQKERN